MKSREALYTHKYTVGIAGSVLVFAQRCKVVAAGVIVFKDKVKVQLTVMPRHKVLVVKVECKVCVVHGCNSSITNHDTCWNIAGSTAVVIIIAYIGVSSIQSIICLFFFVGELVVVV